MAGAYRWLKHEVRELLPAFVFFLIAFNLVVITDALTTEQYGIEPFRVVAAVIGALVVAKAVLLANLLPFVNAFPNKPLIYNTFWKALLYFAAALIVHRVEDLIELTIKYGSLGAASTHLFQQTVWSRFWAIRIWLFVSCLVFAALQELGRALGPGKLRQLFIKG